LDPLKPINAIPVPLTDEEKQAKIDRNPDLLRTYRSIIGSLMYLMVGTRPDISFAVSALSKHLSNPTTLHLAAAKRVVRYLLGTIDKAIVYQSEPGPFRLMAYTDADWAGDKKSRRSQSGGVIIAAGGPILWLSKRQPIVTLSSAESELTALVAITKEVMWMRRVCSDLNVKQEGPTDIFCDNISAMQIAREDSQKNKTKHTAIYYMFVRDEIDDKNVELHYVYTDDNIADLFTKACTVGTFKRLTNKLLRDHL
jgi:hypothetical protein